ncbi:MAG: pyridoxamine 5'-phosphate oxidase family protein [Gammaproteobacteria bacterium]|nr:MAG: pyridoxamine 5'-phosphate oxidase family protein [Gammaproteobacteria bacterium]
MSVIATVEELRAVVGEPPPGLEAKVDDHLNAFARAFIEKCPFLVLSTSDKSGRVDASPKGDAPGFLSVVDEKTLLIPDRPGNRLAYGHLNVIENPQVGLLLVIPNTSETLRINGKAALSADPDLLESLAARGKPAVLAIRVTVEECFFHCGKAFIRSGLWKPEEWAPRHRVSFGEIYAAKEGGDKAMADGLDAMIEQDYRDNL